MTDRERLIELIIQADNECANTINCEKCRAFGTGSDCVNHNIANHLLKNGVIVPPCKVGDTVYRLWSCGKHGKSVAEFVVKHIDIDSLPDIEIAYTKQKTTTGSYFFSKASDFGKTVFLTREEAEKALAERSVNDA